MIRWRRGVVTALGQSWPGAVELTAALPDGGEVPALAHPPLVGVPEVGGRQVISGWDQGVAGMRVGGRRRLVIPPHLGYGQRGVPGTIAPGETLVFVVDLVDVR